METSKSDQLEYTGERMVPEKAGSSVFWEHIYRYGFATSYVKGKRVLDIACGEGYGTAALRDAGASNVIGVDISQMACDHARNRYQIDARVGDAENIPLPDNSVDVVVSFETIEHVLNPEKFIDECIRVLAPNGTLVISTPNKPVYSPEGHHNEFHHSEMTEEEFTALISSRFKKFELYNQKPEFSPLPTSFIRSFQKFSRRVRGHHRIKVMLRKMFCPHLQGPKQQYYRNHPIEAMKLEPTKVSYFVDPYLIRKNSGSTQENPLYFVAVASQAK